MKCPVCNETINENVIGCPNCAFDQLHKEFINESDYNTWFNDTVKPCRTIYLHQQKHSAKITKLERQNKRLQKIINDILLILTKRMTVISRYISKLRCDISPSNKGQRDSLNEISFDLGWLFTSIKLYIPKKYIPNKRMEEMTDLERKFPTDNDWLPF